MIRHSACFSHVVKLLFIYFYIIQNTVIFFITLLLKNNSNIQIFLRYFTKFLTPWHIPFIIVWYSKYIKWRQQLYSTERKYDCWTSTKNNYIYIDKKGLLINTDFYTLTWKNRQSRKTPDFEKAMILRDCLFLFATLYFKAQNPFVGFQPAFLLRSPPDLAIPLTWISQFLWYLAALV